MCRQGASAIQNEVLAKEPSPLLCALVAWVPILKADARPDAGTLGLVSDPRAAHFWDEGGTLALPVKEGLALPGKVPAWDVYLLYAQAALWEGTLPPPSVWQHQLGEAVLPLAPALDGPVMLEHVRSLLLRG